MTFYLPRSKGDRQNQGRTYKAPTLLRLCPVKACQEWLTVSGLSEGSLFRRVDRWGQIGADALCPNSIIPLLRRVIRAAGLPDSYSSHSLRRGFATWANANQWDVKTLMEYVGWKDLKSAMRYIDTIDTIDPFASPQRGTSISPD